MDPNVAALLDTMKQQQQQFVEALNKLTQPVLSCLGPEIFDLLQNLIDSSNMSDQSFDTLIEKLSAHFKVPLTFKRQDILFTIA